ncbi:MAG: glycosyltransferase family 39 protein [Anaerolineae bacterium]|nr:glycosyltransferase family 39 protein [Anaerolineae bacterium]
MTSTTYPVQPSESISQRQRMGGIAARALSSPLLALAMIMLLAAALNLINIEAVGDANTYYTAAVEAMLQSPSNFFFVAAEPGGSVTIDKPPLGLWLQAISAFFLGVNGFAVVLPQILAGIFSVPLLYILVKRWFGSRAGLIAALVMAIMPVSIAVQRNNTMDATLIFTLLLAAYAFIRATETGKLKWLLIGGVLVGLGFNIKMLQAFLPLPAFYALYFLSASVGWRRKILHLALTTFVLLAVSLSWIIVVDLIPTDQRPYVGSSQSNSALELAVGYNGLQRLLGGLGRGGSNAQPFTPGTTTDGQPATPGTDANGQSITPPAGMTPPAGFAGGPPNGIAGGGMFGGEIGSAGVLRLFTQPLDNEIGWLLPFGLLSIGLLVLAGRPRLPLSREHQAVVLWGGWLVTQVIFFSMAGFFHAYYLAMLTPPLAALVGIGLMRIWGIHQQRKWLGIILLISTVGASLVYQMTIAAGYTDTLPWLLIPAGILIIGAIMLVAARELPRYSRLAVAGFVCGLIALTSVPAVWAGASTLSSDANAMLPHAYEGNSARSERMSGSAQAGAFNRPDGMPGAFGGGGVNTELIEYLQANTQGMRWMMAVGSSNEGASYVLETGRGVLYMGGFSGQDPVVDAESLQALVDSGELRYILSGGRRGPGMSSSDISTWLESSCAVVTDVSLGSATAFGGSTLYDCGG